MDLTLASSPTSSMVNSMIFELMDTVENDVSISTPVQVAALSTDPPILPEIHSLVSDLLDSVENEFANSSLAKINASFTDLNSDNTLSEKYLAGTKLICYLANQMKTGTLCLNTAYVYFHYICSKLSIQDEDRALRFATAVFCFACKLEDKHRRLTSIVSWICVYIEMRQIPHGYFQKQCDQLELDENIVMQVVLARDRLQVEHFHVWIAQGAERGLIVNYEQWPKLCNMAYQLASEINRLTTLYWNYSNRILACLAFHVAGRFLNITFQHSTLVWALFDDDGSYQVLLVEELIINNILDKYYDLLVAELVQV